MTHLTWGGAPHTPLPACGDATGHASHQHALALFLRVSQTPGPVHREQVAHAAFEIGVCPDCADRLADALNVLWPPFMPEEP